MLNFKIRLLDIHDKKLEKIFKDQNFKSRGILYLLREVWSSKVDLAFLKHVFYLCKDIMKKQENIVLSIMEYLMTGYKMKPKIWKEAETEVIKEGLLKKGGYMDIRKYIAERARQERDKEVVLNMLKKSAEISFISEVTGLSEKEINKLKNGHKISFPKE